jgi:radical SAM superfamily enzyme YgiQ (UPF0313 family)
MKILLTHAYYLATDIKEQSIMRPYPPLGILSLAAYLEERGADVTVFDTTFSTPETFQEYLLTHRPAYIGIYTNLMTKMRVLDSIRFIRSRSELNDTKIILGGPEVTHHVEKFLEHGADAIVIGEGEETLHELIEAWSSPSPALNDVAGIAYRNGAGEVVRTGARALIKSIDELPFPKRDAIELGLYLDAWKKHHGMNAISVSTMRGCPYSCRWCSRAVYGESYRRRSPSRVADEMQSIHDRYRPDTLWFVDDVFTINHKWLEDFTAELERRRLKIPYECITRADRLNERAVQLLKESGCFRVWIGAESGSQKVLDAMDRRVTVEQVQSMIQLSKRHGIETGTFIMLGYPGETEEDIEATIDHLKRSDPDHYTVTVAYPITGTPFFEDVESEIIDPLPWESSTDRDTEIRRPYSKRYYRYAMSRIFNEVQSHKLEQAGKLLSPKLAKHRAKALAAKMGMRWERK